MFKKIDYAGIVVSDLERAKELFLAFGFLVARGGPLQGQRIGEVVQLSDVNAEYLLLWFLCFCL